MWVSCFGPYMMNAPIEKADEGIGECGLVFWKKYPAAPMYRNSRMWILFTNTKFLNKSAVFVNVFFRVVRKQALALADHREEGAAGGVIFLKSAQVGRKAFNTVGQEGDLGLGVAGVFFITAVFFDDGSNFFFAVIDCHCE